MSEDKVEQVATFRLLQQAQQDISFAVSALGRIEQPFRIPGGTPTDDEIAKLRQYRSDCFALREAIETARICCERARGIVERHNSRFDWER